MSLRWLTVTGVALVVVGMLWLRTPSFSTPIWNVDEGIAAALADKILDGGLPYRHAIDQRPPMTYLVYAAVFAVAGTNNMHAIHVALALIAAATAVALFLLVRRASGPCAAWWAIAAYATLASSFFTPFDLFALHTEWPLSLASALGALLFFVARSRGGDQCSSLGGRGWWFASGLSYGCAALSKQPGLLDFGAPLALLALSCWNGTPDSRRTQLRAAGWLLAGLAAPMVVTIAAFAAFGALSDLIFYTWTYNTRYYVAEVPFGQRIGTAIVPVRLLWDFSPVLCVLGLAGILPMLYRKDADGQRRAVTERPDELFAFVWLLGATYATTLSGRGFHHYSIQLLPPLAWVAGLMLAWVSRMCGEAWRAQRRWRAIPLAIALGVVAVGWGRAALRYRAAIPVHTDPVAPVAAFIREHSTRKDQLFVWGFYSDLYTLTDRLAASRFLYSTFPTGVIPWINDSRDTPDTVVPGTMALLLRDLDRNRPRYFVDTSQSLNRRFTRHPPQLYPDLWAYLCRNYAEIDAGRFSPLGFHVYERLSATSYQPAMSPPASAPALRGELAVPARALAQLTDVQVLAADPAGQLAAIELSVDGQHQCTLTFDPAEKRQAIFKLPAAELRLGRHTVEAAVIARDGRRLSLRQEVEFISTEEAARTAPPFLRLSTPQGMQQGLLVSSTIQPAEIGAFNFQVWLCHAPMELIFPLTGPGTLDLGFGIVEDAYKPPNRTDGVEFRIEIALPDGSRRRLWSRFVDPVNSVADRGILFANVAVPGNLPAGSTLRFITSPGPSGSTSFDWAFWTPPGLRGH